jgi:hypothetical protein
MSLNAPKPQTPEELRDNIRREISRIYGQELQKANIVFRPYSG